MSHFFAKCVDCGHEAPYTATSISCPKCGSEWRETVYDFDSLKGEYTDLIKSRPFGLVAL